MTSELPNLALDLLTFSLLLALQLLLVFALRTPVRKRFGAVACYRLWLLPLLWLPCYLFGPALFAALARLGGNAAPDSGAYAALQQFMQIELLPFAVDLAPGQALAADSSGAYQGWTLLAIFWACGTLALIAWHGCRWLFFSRRVQQLAAPLTIEARLLSNADRHFAAAVPVATLPGINSAALFGVFRPVLLLPQDFAARYDANQRHIILAHEAVHLRRRDNAWSLFALLFIALLWTNPLLWIAWRYFRLDQELSCDALALRRCNDEQQKRYARTLLDSLGSLSVTRPQPALSAWDNLRDIKERSLMIKQHLRITRRPAALITSLALLAVTGAALTLTFAELVSPRALAAEAQPSTGLSEETGRILSDAIAFLNEDRFAEARERLGDLRVNQLTPFERSRLHQLLFNLEMNDEDFAGAHEQLQLALETGGLNEEETSRMQYQQAQLLVQQERYPEAAEALDRWIKSQPSPNSAAYYLLAACFYYMEDYASALPHARTAVEQAEGAAQEAWLQMLASLYMQLERYAEAEPVVAQLAQRFPNKDAYQKQLEGLRMLRAQ